MPERTVMEEVENAVKGYLRAYTLPANVHESNLYGYPNGDTHTKVAERGAAGIAEALKPILAKVWDEGWKQGAWDVEENGWEPHDLSKGPHPANPYKED